MAEKKSNAPATKGSNAISLKREVMGKVESLVSQYMKDGKLHLPANYSPQNAMKSAWLILQDTKDRNRKPALDVCTNQSLTNSLLKMVIQGLDPQKAQCYFIMYDTALACQRSYFGSMALAKRFEPAIAEIPPAQVVYEGDEFEYELAIGKKRVVSHKQKLQNVKKDKIVGAYAMALDKNGKPIRTEIMTIDEIKQSWGQSAMKPVDEKNNIKKGTTQDKFTADMCGKTVINKLCKPIINSSDDSSIMIEVSQKIDEETDRAAAAAEISENANTGEIIELSQVDSAPEDEDSAQEESTATDTLNANDEPEPGEDYLYDYDKCHPCLNRSLCKRLDDPEQIDACKGLYDNKKKPGF